MATKMCGHGLSMLKSWRRFFLYFLVVLGILLGLRLLLQWKFMISRAKESTEDQSPLIIDPNCLAKLAAGQECDYPIGIAIWEKAPIDLSPFLRVQFLLDESKPERNFWLFKNSTDPSQQIATKIFATKLASLRTNDTMLAQLRVPADLAAFSRAWGHGRFLECRPLIVRSPNVERLIPLDYLDRVVQFADLISQHNATAFILGGTLLGWRRECSLIPHTADIDLTIFSEQHSDALLRAILTSETFIVHWVLGRLRDSFELSVNVDGFKIDLFYLYRSENASYIGGMRPQKRQRMRWQYPLLGEICAGEMHGRLLHLPCEHEKVIEADYGAEEWKAPKDTEARWDKANPNHQSLEVYGDEEWPNVYLLVQNKTERFVPAKLDEWMARIGKTA